ncbi:MAG TPA: class I SAM-dependent methyltransferase [Nitrososphaerales archaeon]|nr:class I SAM-dependent methyltransferase [Nitrososphaerales archaeon]
MRSREAVWEESARDYDRFENKWHYYSRVAHGLVQPLGIRRDSRVLELASGTGACTMLLSRLCVEGQVVCVERSSKMVRIAGQNLRRESSRNVSIVEGDVGELYQLVGKMGKFDFVVCNSAFWQFPSPGRLVNSVRNLLEPEGVLAFNLPVWHGSDRDRRAYRNAVRSVLASHGINPEVFASRRRSIDYRRLLAARGFAVIRDAFYSVSMDAEEREDWRQIPAFARRWGPRKGVPSIVLAEIREEAKRRGYRPRPEIKALKNNWRLIIARSRSDRVLSTRKEPRAGVGSRVS